MKKLNLQTKGTYILCLFLSKSQTLTIGKLGKILFIKGYYLYVGKAFGPGGLKARINRHLSYQKQKRWHIDYLKEFCELKFIGVFQNIDIECNLSMLLKENFTSIKKFGSSDCRCESHLFYSQERNKFLEYIKKRGLPPVLFYIN